MLTNFAATFNGLIFKTSVVFFFSGTTPGTCSPPTEEEDASVLRARLDAECQQLARDLQAAVRELVRPELNLVGAANHSKSNGSVCTGTNGIVNNSGAGTARARAMDEIHDYSEIYTPSGDKQDGLPFELSQPPPPPMHRYEKHVLSSVTNINYSFLVGFVVIALCIFQKPIQGPL